MSSLLNIRRLSSLLFSSGGDIEYALRRPIEGDENARAEAGSVDGRIRVASRNRMPLVKVRLLMFYCHRARPIR